MSRILLTWELGQNLGHLTRLRQLAERLGRRGHTVMVAVRDVAAAAEVLADAGIPFVQAPGAIKTAVPAKSAGYPDILLVNGWRDRTTLRGLIHAWKNLFEMFRPDRVVLDHAPTAALAARISGIRYAWVCNGFGLPPPGNPLPPFPGFSWATPTLSAASEQIALDNANGVVSSLSSTPLKGLKDLFATEDIFCTSFAELDHYGERPGLHYVGPLAGARGGQTVAWPAGSSQRIFAYLRPKMTGLIPILTALKKSEAAVICYAPGLDSTIVDRFISDKMLFPSRPVQFSSIFRETDVCVTYAPSGSVTTGLLHGIPQLMVPSHVESYLTARRVELLGAGLALRGDPEVGAVESSLDQLLHSDRFRWAARQFSERYRAYDAEASVDRVVDRLSVE